MKDNNESMAGYINEKVKEYLTTSSAFFAQIQSNQKALTTIKEKIIKLKADKGDKGFTEARGQLISLQEVHYNMFLLDQSTKHLQGVIFEYNVMATLFKVELDIPEGAQAYFKTVISTSPHIFTLQDGKPAMVDNAITSTLMKALQEKIESEEALKQLYMSM